MSNLEGRAPTTLVFHPGLARNYIGFDVEDAEITSMDSSCPGTSDFCHFLDFNAGI